MNVEEDIMDDNIYSIQEDKLNTEEDNKKTAAEKRKQKILHQVKMLQAKFQELLNKNTANEQSFRLSVSYIFSLLSDYFLKEDELVVDPRYQEVLQNEVSDILEETRKELSWGLAYNELKVNKLKEYFLDELHSERICLKSFDSKHKVYAFKVKNLSPYIEVKLEEINREIEEENRIQAEETSTGFQKQSTTNFEDSRLDDKSKRLISQGTRSMMKLQTGAFDGNATDNKSKFFSKQMTQSPDQPAGKLGNTFGAGGPNATGTGNLNATATNAPTGYQKYDRERVRNV